MPFTEDATTQDVYLGDFGVTCIAGSNTGLGVLEQPDQILAGDMLISTEYELTTRTAIFGSLVSGDSIIVESIPFTVRDIKKENDGTFCRLSLSKN
tara:strand:- start:12192 stop:12479 length:288 start_codon:yes stop_codon:yes gene_type:complete